MIELLGDAKSMEAWVSSVGLQNLPRAQTNIDAIARSGMAIDQFESICQQLAEQLPTLSDPDLALNCLLYTSPSPRDRG